ncbi:cupin domain-containing protein [Puia sp. P3]|uniref:cupin domain-containing protein n=1 Tax=Puia sp. P3 TaxID=3423952 RepID=UPI003D6788CD
MKRDSFLKLTLSAFAAIAAPLATLATRVQRASGRGFYVPAGKDRAGSPLVLFEGDTFFSKVSTEDAGGALYIYESTRVKPGGPPLHVHYDQDEWWYILRGTFLIKVGDQVYTAKAGDSVFGPRTIPHCFAKVGDGEARMLMVFNPAGKMEAFFTAISKGETKGMTPEQNAQFRKDHGFEVVGPPLTFLKQ